MYAKSFVATSALVAAVAAVPMINNQKRDVVWVTDTEVATVTVPVTTTIWVDPTETRHAHWGHHGHPTSHVTSYVTVPAASSPASSAESSPESSSVAPEPTSTYVAPSSSSVYVAPTTSTSQYVAPTPTSTYVAPTSTYVAPTTSSAAPAASSSSASSSGSGETYSGDITHYDVGMGSCGYTNSDDEAVVAIPTDMMNNTPGGNPNDNPLCGTHVTIKYGGVTTQAKIVDTCGGCYKHSIDLSPTLFTTVAPHGDGRVHDVEWWFNSS